MNGQGNRANGDESVAGFDEAIARLEADVVAAARALDASVQPVTADLSEFEEAFSQIDRQLAAHQPSLATASPTPAVVRPRLARVIPAPAPAARRTLPTQERSDDVDSLWRLSTTATPLERLVVTMQNLAWLQAALRSASAAGEEARIPEAAAEIIAATRRFSVDLELASAQARVEFTMAAMERQSVEGLSTEVGELIRHIRHDLQSCAMWPVRRGRSGAHLPALDEHAARAVPAAAQEMAEAARSAGFGLHNATVFHVLRAAQRGLRGLSATPGTPAAGVDWPKILARLEAMAATAPGGELSSVLHDARLLHDAERRLAGGGGFDEHHALAVLRAGCQLLNRVAQAVIPPP
jgi:hypothetical protein